MTKCINVCHGWSCNLVTKCARSDFNYEATPRDGTWSRHYMESHTGESCASFEPLRHHRYGDGPDSEAND